MESEVISAIILGLSKVLQMVAPDRLTQIKKDIDRLVKEHEEEKQEFLQAANSGNVDILNKFIHKYLS